MNFVCHGEESCDGAIHLEFQLDCRARHAGLAMTNRVSSLSQFAIKLRLNCRKAGACLQAIQLVAIAHRQAPPNRVNLISKADWNWEEPSDAAIHPIPPARVTPRRRGPDPDPPSPDPSINLLGYPAVFPAPIFLRLLRLFVTAS